MRISRSVVPWFWLAGISLLLSTAFVSFLTLAMLSRSGSHTYWCPRAPEGFVFSCIPSPPAVQAGTLMILLYSLPPFAVGAAVLIVMGIMRRMSSRSANASKPQ